MPWRIEDRESGFVVVQENSGEVVGTHDTREEAEAHLAALYASEDNKKARGGIPGFIADMIEEWGT